MRNSTSIEEIEIFYLLKEATQKKVELPKNKYELSNHLGNVLVTTSDLRKGTDNNADGIADYYQADVRSANDYFAFGSLMPARQFNSTAYKFGFNGKENDNEVKGIGNQQDYGMRIYDPRLGRFLSVDPDAEQYPFWTPYSFAANKPIACIDEEGRGVVSGIVGFAIDAGMQFIIGLAMYDGNAEVSFKNIDWTQATISGVQSAIPLKPPGGKYGRAAFDAASDVVINAARGKYSGLSGDAYKWAIIKDFAIGAVTSLGSQALVSKVKSWLGSFKTVTKPSAAITPNNKIDIQGKGNISGQSVHSKTSTSKADFSTSKPKADGTNINPSASTKNCVGTAIATKNTLDGAATTALPDKFSNPKSYVEDISNAYPTSSIKNASSIGSVIKQFGISNQNNAIVIGFDASGNGHAFNIQRLENGMVQFIDNQSKSSPINGASQSQLSAIYKTFAIVLDGIKK